jgi:hypothetical protein
MVLLKNSCRGRHGRMVLPDYKALDSSTDYWYRDLSDSLEIAFYPIRKREQRLLRISGRKNHLVDKTDS